MSDLGSPSPVHALAASARAAIDRGEPVLPAVMLDGHSLNDVARFVGLRLAGLEELYGFTPDFSALSLASSTQRKVARAVSADQSAVLFITDPFDASVANWGQRAGPVLPEVLVSTSDFDSWISTWSQGAQALSSVALDQAGGEVGSTSKARVEELSLQQLDTTTSPVIKLVNSTLYDALRLGASDVHLETLPHGMSVKFRVDGVLKQITEIQGESRAEQVISRVKVMAELDIAERRVPQDGRMQVTSAGRAIDIRVSIMPSVHGEDAVLRILDRLHLAKQFKDLKLDALGFNVTTSAPFLALARRPHGMVLVTGPTGSGKTTTLYAAINQTCSVEEKVITIEDPVEYHLSGVLQIPVNERKGLTFALGLRSVLRHDPDKILVGEIRDAETAQIAVQAALTGHLVFSTVHANDAFDVLGRFQQFGLDGYALVSALNGVMAQRLLRKVCAHCKTHADAPATIDETRDLIGVARWTRGTGCPSCLNTGYKGRFAIGELLVMTRSIKALIASRAPYGELYEAATAQGLVSLRKQAVQAAFEGLTTWEEIERATAA